MATLRREVALPVTPAAAWSAVAAMVDAGVAAIRATFAG